MTFNPSALTQVADYFKVLSELSRLQVLCSLKSGIVSRTPQGVSVYYEIVETFIFDLCELVSDRLSIRLQEQSQQLKQLEGMRRNEPIKASQKNSKAKVKSYA
jgi:hypothetical protein